MSRIPDELIDRIKREVLLEELARRAGVELRPVGRELTGRCPFPPHEDSTPSLSINVERNVFQCFGCGVAGSPIDWVEKERRLEFRAAVEWLLWEFFPEAARELLVERRPAASGADGPRRLSRRSRAPELPCPFDLSADEQTTLDEYAAFCHALLKESSEARDYLKKRGLSDPDLVSRFTLGYQDRTLGLRLPTPTNKANQEVRARFQRLGLIRPSGHGHFVGSLLVPTIDLCGHVTGIYGRKTRDDLNKDHASPRHLYLPGPDRDVFNEEAFLAGKDIVLCESRIDAMTFWRWGIKNVTACRGVHLSEALLSAFVHHRTERCFLAFDRDGAGDAGAVKVAETLMDAGVECLRVLFPKGMDANEVALKMQPADKTLALFVRSAEWIGSGRKPPGGGGAPPGAAREVHEHVAPAAAPTPVAHEAPSSAAEAATLAEDPAATAGDATPPPEATEEGGVDTRGHALEQRIDPVKRERDEATEERSSIGIGSENASEPAPPSPTLRFAQVEPVSGAVPRSREPALPPAEAASPAPPPGSSAGAVVTLSRAPGRVDPVEPELGGATERGSSTGVGSENAPQPVSQAAPAAAFSPSPIAGLLQAGEDEAFFAFEDRRYRVFGLQRCHSLSALPITLKAQREGDSFAPPCPISGWFLDKLDLVASRQRDLFEKRAAHELGVREDVVRRDLGFLLGGLERLQEERLKKALEPKPSVPQMTAREREEALDFWRSPGLLSRIVEHFTACGLVGEETNKLLCYVAAVSRLLERPLAILIQSSSAAGKTSLMEALLSLLPEESYEKYTAVSGKSLFYFDDETSLRHKVLAIVEEEGAEKATYPLKLLHSEGELRMASTGKDPQTGRLVTQVYKVEGPVMIILTTTAIELDPELENRCLRLTVDESRQQTRLIHELQRKRQTLEGLLAQKRKAALRALHRNAQRLLRPLKVLNPYEPYLTFVDDQTRTRRDHEKYLTIIEALALLHQHQRPLVPVEVEGEITECVTVALEDIELAGRLAGEVLGRTLDELQPQTRRFLTVLYQGVSEVCEKEGVQRRDLHLTRKQIRELTGWGDTQVKVHLGRLIDLEYVLPHRAPRGNGTVFELLYGGEGKRMEKFVLGLVDVEKLRLRAPAPATETAARWTPLEPVAPSVTPTANRSDLPGDRSGFSEHRSGVGRPPVGPRPGGGRVVEMPPEPAREAGLRDPEREDADSSRLPAVEAARRSYPGAGPTRLNGTPLPRLLVNLLRHPPLEQRATSPEEPLRVAAHV